MDDLFDDLFFEEINDEIEHLRNEMNNRKIKEFEGYSPNEMQFILYNPLDKDSPIKLKRLSEADFKKVPILNQIKYFLRIIDEAGELKLTPKGYLPVKIVTDIYNRKYMTDGYIESGMYKLYNEKRSMTVHLTRILAEMSGLIKKRKNKLSLTNKGKEVLSDDYTLLKIIFLTYGMKLNWAYLDRFGDHEVGQLGFGFSLILLSKYGYKKKPDSFYAGKYFSAFPAIIEQVEPIFFESKENEFKRCYSTRTFDKFLKFFGLVEIDTVGKWGHEKKFVKKTELFDKMIKIKPHRNIVPSTDFPALN